MIFCILCNDSKGNAKKACVRWDGREREREEEEEIKIIIFVVWTNFKSLYFLLLFISILPLLLLFVACVIIASKKKIEF